MPRRAAVERPASIHLHIPEGDKAWLDQHLWSEVDSRVPQGAYREWVLARLREYREWKVLDLAPYGFPQGMFVRGPQEALRLLIAKLEGKAELEGIFKHMNALAEAQNG